jgi:hypothetical protein
LRGDDAAFGRNSGFADLLGVGELIVHGVVSSRSGGWNERHFPERRSPPENPCKIKVRDGTSQARAGRPSGDCEADAGRRPKDCASKQNNLC